MLDHIKKIFGSMFTKPQPEYVFWYKETKTSIISAQAPCSNEQDHTPRF